MEMELTHTHTESDRQTDRITQADQRYSHATTVGVSNYGALGKGA